MNDKELWDVLVAMHGTKEWEAIKIFARARDTHALNAIGSIDPFKNPTELARSQGLRIGIYALEREIEAEKSRRDEAEEGEKVGVEEDTDTEE